MMQPNNTEDATVAIRIVFDTPLAEAVEAALGEVSGAASVRTFDAARRSVLGEVQQYVEIAAGALASARLAFGLVVALLRGLRHGVIVDVPADGPVTVTCERGLPRGTAVVRAAGETVAVYDLAHQHDLKATIEASLEKAREQRGGG